MILQPHLKPLIIAAKRNPAAIKTIQKKDLKAILDFLDYRYFEASKPVVSDELYDLLVDHYENLTGKTRSKVGHAVTGKRVKAKLPEPMASLDKLKPDSNTKFLTKGEYVVSDKLDGLSLELVYNNGKLLAVYTRGDGTTGQDVTRSSAMLNAPKTIADKNELIVRAEFCIKKHTFNKKHSTETGNTYKTGRNMASGLLTRNESTEAIKDFDVVCYEVMRGKTAGQKISTQLQYLKKLQFSVVKHKVYQNLTLAQLSELHDDFKSNSHYDCDGIVVTKNVSYKSSFENPKHAMAFKINSLASSKVVSIVDIEWNLSRHNKLVPRIRIEPTELGGVTVQYLTGHNMFFIRNGFKFADKDKRLPVRPLGVGAQIRIIRSGDVIPYIMEVVKPARKPSEPAVPYTTDGVTAMAVKSDIKNPDIKKKQILHFFKVLEVDGLKSGTVDMLFDSGLNTVSKIIKADADKFLTIDGFQTTKATKLADSIKAKLSGLTFPKLAYASGVFGSNVGETRLQAIYSKYPNILSMADMPYPQLVDKLEQVDGIKTAAADIAKRLPKFAKFVEFHKFNLVSPKATKKKSQKLAGMKVLFTSVRDKELETRIVENGGSLASTVKSATHLIAKPGASNNKIDYAKENKLPVLTVEAFIKKFLEN